MTGYAADNPVPRGVQVQKDAVRLRLLGDTFSESMPFRVAKQSEPPFYTTDAAIKDVAR